eukprot:6490285-Amphidinium_carterae.1
MATGERTMLGDLVKALPKPSKLEKSTQWFQWRFEFENYMSCMNPNFHDELDLAVQSSQACVVPADPGIQSRSYQLFAMLASLTAERPAEIVRSLRESRNGYEAWRLLVLEYEPQLAASKYTLLYELLEAKELDGLDPEHYQSAIMRWEEKIRRYEQMPGDKPGEGATLAEDIKRAILLKKAPSAMQAYLRVQMTDHTTYVELKNRIDSYLRSLRSTSSQSVPMDIGAVTPGQSKWGKGSSKQQQHPSKSTACRCCGKEGHAKSDCPHKDKTCRVCGKAGHLASVCRQNQQPQPVSQKGSGKGKDGKKGSKGRGQQKGQVGAVEEVTEAPAEGLTAAIGWIMAMTEAEPSSSSSSIDLLLVDSGATHSVFMEHAFQQTPLLGHSGVSLRNISGEELKLLGQKTVKGQTDSGRPISCTGAVAEVKRNVLSVNKLQRQGFTVVFSPTGAWVCREAVLKPSGGAEKLEQIDGLWYLRVHQKYSSTQKSAIVAAVGDEAMSENEPPHPEAQAAAPATSIEGEAETGPRLGDRDVQMLDIAPMQSEYDEQYATLTRRDRKAWRYRAPRQRDPCTRASLVRRITWKVRDGSILCDEFMADLDENYSLSKALPNAPTDIYTKYYYRVSPEPPIQVMARDSPAEEAMQALPTPVLPDDMTRAHHNVTHTPYADWCQHCVAGRSRGEKHERTANPDPKDAEFEVDWTFYGPDATPSTSQGASASSSETLVTVLGIVHRGTGMTAALAVPSKGKGNFAETMCVRFILLTSGAQQKLRLRADGEPASRAFLQAVAARLKTHGISAQPEHTERASHQSVGAVERSHSVVAAFLRTLLSQVQEATNGWRPDPTHPVFLWAVRHAAWLYSHHHRGHDRLTAFSRMTGKVDIRKLAQYGEKVLAQVNTDKARSKSAPRWVPAIWVGVPESLEASSSYVTLTLQGVLLTRCVRRLALQCQWDTELLQTVVGLPWSPKESKHRAVSTPAFPPVALERNSIETEVAEGIMVTPEPSVPKPEATPHARSHDELGIPPKPEPQPTAVPQMMEEDNPQMMEEETPQLSSELKRTREIERESYEPTWLATPTEEFDEPSQKRAKASMVALIAHTQDIATKVQQFLESEISDTRPQAEYGWCGNLEELASMMTPEVITEGRKEEIRKLEMFKGYTPVRATDYAGHRVFQHRWVDAVRHGKPKCRITLKDLKVVAERAQRKVKAKNEEYNNEDIPSVQSPTPAHMSNRMLMFVCIHEQLSHVSIDYVSAFLHAPEDSEVLMVPPELWEDEQPEPRGTWLWLLSSSLYGRRNAPSQFRNLCEAVMCSLKSFEFVRCSLEPCLFVCRKTRTRVTHHLDDVRGVGTDAWLRVLVDELRQHLLMKTTKVLKTGCSHSYLGRLWIVQKGEVIIVPDSKHVEKLLAALGYDGREKQPPKPAATPGVPHTSTEEPKPLGEKEKERYRSLTGSMIYLSMDVEEVAYSVKELARSMSSPSEEDWLHLTRLGRYLVDKSDWGIRLKDVAVGSKSVNITVQVDASWGSAHRIDGRSTSGFRVLINGFQVSHGSYTQPGLPAMSSAEAELRAVTRAAVEALYAKHLAEEFLLEVGKTTVTTDASAAWQSAIKLGPGRLRHLQAASFFVKEATHTGSIVMSKIPGTQNPADILTKYIDAATLKRHSSATGYGPVECKHQWHDAEKLNDIEDIKMEGQRLMNERRSALQLQASQHVQWLKSTNAESRLEKSANEKSQNEKSENEKSVNEKSQNEKSQNEKSQNEKSENEKSVNE